MGPPGFNAPYPCGGSQKQPSGHPPARTPGAQVVRLVPFPVCSIFLVISSINIFRTEKGALELFFRWNHRVPASTVGYSIYFTVWRGLGHPLTASTTRSLFGPASTTVQGCPSGKLARLFIFRSHQYIVWRGPYDFNLLSHSKIKIIPILVQLGILCCTGHLTTLLPLIFN